MRRSSHHGPALLWGALAGAALAACGEPSAEVFPALYLPIVEEANLRVWKPWRAKSPMMLE